MIPALCVCVLHTPCHCVTYSTFRTLDLTVYPTVCPLCLWPSVCPIVCSVYCSLRLSLCMAGNTLVIHGFVGNGP